MKAQEIIIQALHDNFSEFTEDQASAVIEALKLEGFVLVPKELSENIAHQLAKSEFKKSEIIFNSSYRDLSIDAKNDLKQKWIEQKTRCIVVDYKTLIGKAQEQSHD